MQIYKWVPQQIPSVDDNLLKSSAQNPSVSVQSASNHDDHMTNEANQSCQNKENIIIESSAATATIDETGRNGLVKTEMTDNEDDPQLTATRPNYSTSEVTAITADTNAQQQDLSNNLNAVNHGSMQRDTPPTKSNQPNGSSNIGVLSVDEETGNESSAATSHCDSVNDEDSTNSAKNNRFDAETEATSGSNEPPAKRLKTNAGPTFDKFSHKNTIIHSEQKLNDIASDNKNATSLPPP